MDKAERTLFMKAMGSSVRDYVEKVDERIRSWVSSELKALTELFDERIRQIPTPEKGDKGDKGESIKGDKGDPADPAEIQELRTQIRVLEERIRQAPTPETSIMDLRRAVSGEIESVLAHFNERLDKLPTPKDGKDAEVDYASIRNFINEEVAKIPPPKNGKDAEPVDVDSIEARLIQTVHAECAHVNGLIKDEIAAAVQALPPPPKGDPGKDGIVPTDKIVSEIDYQITQRIAAIPAPKDGKDAVVDYELLKRHLMDEVQRAVSEIPKPKDGESIHPDTVRLMVIDEVKKEFATIPPPKPPEKGEPGRDALTLEPTDGIDFDRSYIVGQWATHNGGLWRCIDGKNWKCMVDGHSGVEEVYDGERTIKTVHRFASGKTQEFMRTTKEVIDRGVYKVGNEYERGDGVSKSGSFWICQVDKTSAVPGDSSDWRLAVKAGRDAKPLPPPPGPSKPIKLQ